MLRVQQRNFLYAIGRIRQRLFAFLEQELARENIVGITPSYGDVIYLLDKKGSLSINEISQLSLKDKSTITNIINRLEEGGYIIREKDGRDRRRVNIRLTGKAACFKPAMLRISQKMNSRIFKGLSEDEKTQLFALMTRISKNVEGR